jgi:paraquat-inducible protein B
MRSQAVVGGFVLGGIVLALSAVVLFGKFSLFNPAVQAAVVFQGSIKGLSVGAPVTFRGVGVGAVESVAIDFDPKTQVAYIPVIVRLRPSRTPGTRTGAGGAFDLPKLVAGGLRAELNLQSFVTGQSQIDLDFDPSAPPVMHPDVTTLPEIPVRLSSLQRAAEQLSQLPLRELADNTTATLNSREAGPGPATVGGEREIDVGPVGPDGRYNHAGDQGPAGSAEFDPGRHY